MKRRWLRPLFAARGLPMVANLFKHSYVGAAVRHSGAGYPVAPNCMPMTQLLAS